MISLKGMLFQIARFFKMFGRIYTGEQKHPDCPSLSKETILVILAENTSKVKAILCI